ncbi:hypothetical protein, partial [Nocardia abscessus]|uniref:hypothetical protein n=1 Tax=Nocardia abscessus TaxID=120957 RepID=UPI0024548343
MGELTHQSLGTGTDKAIRRHPGRTFGPGGGGGGAPPPPGPDGGRGGGRRGGGRPARAAPWGAGGGPRGGGGAPPPPHGPKVRPGCRRIALSVPVPRLWCVSSP